MMKLDMLGPSRYWYDDQELAFTPLERHAHIALRLSGGALSMAELAECLWVIPSSASLTTLRGCLSRPRRKVVAAGGTADELSKTVRVSGGRTMVVSTSEWDIDAERFRGYAASAREAYEDHRFDDASRYAKAADALWFDRPLPDTGDRPYAERHKEELLSIHLSLTLTWIKADVSLGSHREVIPILSRLQQAQPHEGEIPVLLATALYRCANIPEAARVCELAIADREGKGIEARRLQDLQSEILNEALPARGPLPW